jgi:diguanylate cyclase (GGDEF)-like protein
LFAELLGAEAVAVLLGDQANSRRFLNRAFFGHPALAEAAPLLVDALGDDRSFTSAGTTFIAEPARVQRLANAARCVRALAIVPLPGTDEMPIGIVIAMWASNRRHLPASARQAAELLSEEAGRMFQRLQDEAALTRDAETDPLTDLANRRTFARALATVQPGDALVIVDLDHFKRVNDRYGHQAGDAALRTLAGCLRETARQVDCVARYGGEEFALILPEAGALGAHALLARVRDAWSAEQPLTTFSAGVAVHAGDVEPRETLRRADAALYEAKEAGRNRDVYAPETLIDVTLP